MGCWNCGSTVLCRTECDEHMSQPHTMIRCLACNCRDYDECDD